MDNKKFSEKMLNSAGGDHSDKEPKPKGQKLAEEALSLFKKNYQDATKLENDLNNSETETINSINQSIEDALNSFN